MKGIGQKVNQTAEYHANLILLHQLQILEMLECYREFCYQLYLFSLSFGEVSSAKFANGVHSFMGHDSAGYLGTIVSGTGSAYIGNVQRLDYSYDGLGNVLTREDNSIAGKNITDTFGYDSMNRLTSINTSSDVQGAYATAKTYSYNSIGNITYQTGIGSYTYYADKPHALKSAGARNYTYDAVGNTVNRNGDTITYNPLNKPATLTNHLNNKTVTFTYGAGGQRYQKQTSDGILTYYIGKLYEEQVEDNTEKQTCYITLGGKTIGTHVEVKDTDYVTTNPHYNEATYNRYFHTDALGSITAITDDAGTVVERRSYEPFGKIRAMDYGTNNNTIANTTIQTTRAFTGHEQIAELSGLIHMNARVYDSDIGRFLSADTVIQDPHDSQSYNRYSYVRNNPLKYTDPTGNSWWTKFRDKWLKPIVSIVISAVIIAGSGGVGLLGGLLGNIGVAGGAALAGGISGAIMTGTVTGAFKGALFGVFSAGIAQAVVGATSSLMGVGTDIAHKATLLKAGMRGVGLVKSMLHGLTRGVIGLAQGGTFKAGFASGFFSSGFDVGTEGYGGFTGRTTIMGIVGGTASEIGGGKFSNGAISGAFVHMFNAEGRAFLQATLSGWKSDGNGRYRTWVSNGRDTGNRANGSYEYYNGRSPSERFFNGVGQGAVYSVQYVGEHGDGIGLILSLGAMATPGGWGYAMGVAAIGIDISQSDNLGTIIGVAALVTENSIIDIGYGLYQVY
jgi:RHS repeat-associated protein